VVVAESLVCAGETSYAGVAVQLADPYDFAEALRVGVELAKRAPEESDFFFCVLPVHRSAIVLDRSYLFTRWRALELDKGEPTDNWETLATAPIPPAVLPLFPSLRVVPSRKLFLRSAPLVVGMAAAVYGASRALGPLKVMSGKWAAQALAQQSERIERYARSAQELIDGLLKALEEEQLLGTTGVAERLWTLHRALDEPAALEPKLVGPDAAEELLRLVQDL
jgi:hypothetical protein